MTDPLIGATVSANWYDSNPLEVVSVDQPDHFENDHVRVRDNILGEESWAKIEDVTVVCREHDWRGVSVSMTGHGSLGTHAVEQCCHCKLYRKNDNPEFVDWEEGDVKL